MTNSIQVKKYDVLTVVHKRSHRTALIISPRTRNGSGACFTAIKCVAHFQVENLIGGESFGKTRKPLLNKQLFDHQDIERIADLAKIVRGAHGRNTF